MGLKWNVETDETNERLRGIVIIWRDNIISI